MRLPASAQTTQPWRIHELIPDYRLEDVWVVPTPGGPDDFDRLLALFTTRDPSQDTPVVRALFAARWQLGRVLGWDDPVATPTPARTSLRERLPAELRDSCSGRLAELPHFTSLYRTDREWAAELSNRTMHGVLHLGWVTAPGGGYRGQLSVYVKRNGLLGTAYMAAIAPFRYLLVYPLMLRRLGQEWQALSAEAPG